jgi:hypothetical protein
MVRCGPKSLVSGGTHGPLKAKVAEDDVVGPGDHHPHRRAGHVDGDPGEGAVSPSMVRNGPSMWRLLLRVMVPATSNTIDLAPLRLDTRHAASPPRCWPGTSRDRRCPRNRRPRCPRSLRRSGPRGPRAGGADRRGGEAVSRFRDEGGGPDEGRVKREGAGWRFAFTVSLRRLGEKRHEAAAESPCQGRAASISTARRRAAGAIG